jgi:hypothetical protein
MHSKSKTFPPDLEHPTVFSMLFWPSGQFAPRTLRETQFTLKATKQPIWHAHLEITSKGATMKHWRLMLLVLLTILLVTGVAGADPTSGLGGGGG